MCALQIVTFALQILHVDSQLEMKVMDGPTIFFVDNKCDRICNSRNNYFALCISTESI